MGLSAKPFAVTGRRQSLHGRAPHRMGGRARWDSGWYWLHHCDQYPDSTRNEPHELPRSVPSTISVTGMSDLMKFSGISLDTILKALEDTADDSSARSREVRTTDWRVPELRNGEYTGGSLRSLRISGKPSRYSLPATPQFFTAANRARRSYRILPAYPPTFRSGWLVGRRSMALRIPPGRIQRNFSNTRSILSEVSNSGRRRRLLNLVTDDEIAGVSLKDGASTATGSLSRVRVRDGELYNNIPVLGKSLAEVLGDGAVCFASGFGNAIEKVRNSAQNIQQLESQLNANCENSSIWRRTSIL